MSKQLTSRTITLAPADNRRLAMLCGELSEHLRIIERYFGIEINHRSYDFQITGNIQTIDQACTFLEKLYTTTATTKELTLEQIHWLLQEFQTSPDSTNGESSTETTIIRTRHGIIKGRGANQQRYIDNIMRHAVNFGLGPAGTGKTYLAVACAVEALEKGLVQRLILVRPAVEAGEKLGFLPGDLTQKVDPYLRPLYDALFEMLGIDKVTKFIGRNIIEIAPLAYMRGRTLNDAFIILDESQNTTKAQMRMFLTRIGFGSTAVITGDITQVDLPKGVLSGLRHAVELLRNVPGISFTFFKTSDIVRHPLVQSIVEAYETEEMAERSL